ncbi:glycosyltransferase family 2 protein [Macrococcus sp. DPC7161]|uniref:glycosyltransferase family 2 protein n=1 Tax=Macrococcus sp. DPC7161 TaxID=2507060 RepID=UPI00100B5162|nr:glycosyltransferase family 2 protein [Macrococcus sp. DPC7161]RXK18799.1 glycosyltransferase family 2 protein [Macrococcus sp. DPC7161]
MITVVIPVYNASEYIQRALASIQSIKAIPIEILCINDGSTDDSVNVIEEYKNDLPNYQTLRILSKANQGAAAARNEGIQHARFPYIMFLDSDDQLAPNAIDIFVDALQKYPNHAVYVGQLVHFKNNQIIKLKNHQLKPGPTTLSEQPELLQSIGPGAKLYHRQWIKKGFDSGITFCEEHTFNTRVFLKSVFVLNEIVYYYTQDDRNSITQDYTNLDKYMKDAIKVRKNMFTLINTTNDIETNVACDRVKAYYSYRMDNLIISYLLKNALQQKASIQFQDSIIPYLNHIFEDTYDEKSLIQLIEFLFRYLNQSDRMQLNLYLRQKKFDFEKLNLNPNHKMSFIVKRSLNNTKDQIKLTIKKRLKH